MKIRKNWSKLTYKNYEREVDYVIGDYTIYFDLTKGSVNPYILVPNEDPTGRKHCYHFATLKEAERAAYEKMVRAIIAKHRNPKGRQSIIAHRG